MLSANVNPALSATSAPILRKALKDIDHLISVIEIIYETNDSSIARFKIGWIIATIAFIKGAAAIFTKPVGAMVGLLLVAYGALSLWLGNATLASTSTKAKFCEFWLCPHLETDSPTSFDAVADRPLAQAEAELILSPASPYRWADLGDAEIDVNRVDAGKFCMRQALSAAPGNPAILFRAASFYLRLEDYPETLQQLTAVLRNPDLEGLYSRVFSLYSQMDLPLEDLLNQGLPKTPVVADAFLRFWINQGKLDEAQVTWNWIGRNGLMNLQSAGSYVKLLARNDRWDEAMQSWSDYTAHLDTSYGKTNWIYNGSFEMKPVDCPFDWHLHSTEKASVIRDTEIAYRGHTSLRLDFSARPAGSEGAPAYQTVFLGPGEWRLKANMKTRDLTSDQGVVIRVVDAEDPSKLDVVTNSFQGTEEWTAIGKTFEIAQTKRARVEIIRPRSRDFDSPLKGTVWIDAVTLEPLPREESFKTTGLAQPSQPCEGQGECGDGEVRLQTAAKKNR